MLPKNRINRLPKETADKIAAGEVVDRPLSIVKELIENAIDAGANVITVEIKNGGKTYIRITDNGCGISKADLCLAFQRHATSKINDAKDLDFITTLGFRGEALASIAAVSKIEVITKTKEEKVGSRIMIEGGQMTAQGDTGCPDGTTAIVRDLFYNTPARLKFLKQDGTESSLIIDFVSKIALAYPSIRIHLINNAVTLFATPGKGSVYANILTIYSKDIKDKLLKTTSKDGDYEIEAYLSSQNISKPNRKSQVFFVNGRYIKNKIFEDAITKAYEERIPEGRHPIVFMFLKVAPNRLDVNIHPNKREIRFDDNDNISEFVIKSIQKGLTTKEGIPEIKKEKIFRVADKLQELKSTNNETENQVDIKELLSTKRQNSKEVDFVMEESPDHEVPFDLSTIRVTNSIFGTYIIGNDDENLYLIDQHAAHERVFYEKLLAIWKAEEKASQGLLAPFVVQVPLTSAHQLESLIDPLYSMGFILEEFGLKSIIIKGVPAFMSLPQAKEFMNHYLDEISRGKEFTDKVNLDTIIMSACKSAVKANQLLDIKEMEQLIKDLSKTSQPFNCPHGRPTLIKLTKREIEKLFKRV